MKRPRRQCCVTVGLHGEAQPNSVEEAKVAADYQPWMRRAVSPMGLAKTKPTGGVRYLSIAKNVLLLRYDQRKDLRKQVYVALAVKQTYTAPLITTIFPVGVDHIPGTRYVYM